MRALLIAFALALPASAEAFCGFYVGKAGAELYNHASQVVLVRDGERTVITMSNDFQGSMRDFALVVPVPTLLEKEQIHIGDRKLVERLDGYSAPRLVEYFDPNPCEDHRMVEKSDRKAKKGALEPGAASEEAAAAALGVKIEAEYTVGEYDIVILSAKQSDGLETWLIQSGYQIPPRSSEALKPYIKQGMKFFVAKVNLEQQKANGFSYLRPIQIAYESEKFMLPIRLGMANSQGEQDLLVFTLTKNGRVESTNYRTDKVPSDVEVPLYVKEDFAPFYTAVFATTHRQTDYRTVHTEYVWDTGWCDPCADQPLSHDELNGLGVFWLDDPAAPGNPNQPTPRIYKRGRYGGAYGASQPILTRLHVRYDREHFPEDLLFQETGDRQNFQARYILRHAATGDLSCEAGKGYLAQLEARREAEVATLTSLTGWKREEVLPKMGSEAPKGQGSGDSSWYKNLWK